MYVRAVTDSNQSRNQRQTHENTVVLWRAEEEKKNLQKHLKLLLFCETTLSVKLRNLKMKNKDRAHEQMLCLGNQKYIISYPVKDSVWGKSVFRATCCPHSEFCDIYSNMNALCFPALWEPDPAAPLSLKVALCLLQLNQGHPIHCGLSATLSS